MSVDTLRRKFAEWPTMQIPDEGFHSDGRGTAITMHMSFQTHRPVQRNLGEKGADITNCERLGFEVYIEGAQVQSRAGFRESDCSAHLHDAGIRREVGAFDGQLPADQRAC